MSTPNYRLNTLYFSAEFWPTKELFQVRPQHIMYVVFFKQVSLNLTNNKEDMIFRWYHILLLSLQIKTAEAALKKELGVNALIQCTYDHVSINNL